MMPKEVKVLKSGDTWVYLRLLPYTSPFHREVIWLTMSWMY